MLKITVLWIVVALGLLAQSPVKPVDGQGRERQAEPGGNKYVALMQAVPNVSTALTGTTTKVQVILCHNATGGAVTLTITDNQGSPVTYWPAVSLAANSVAMLYSGVGFTMTSGIKWSASASTSIYCQIEGVQ